MRKTDLQLKRDIEAELGWDPKVNAAHIGVAVDAGAVSLHGIVDTYAEKGAAEMAVKRVAGVRSIAQDLTVNIQEDHRRTDPEIATAIQVAFKWHVGIPATITATVEHGWVMLEGHATWNHQREAAERVVRDLTGVVAVQNSIILAPETSAAAVKEKVEAALQRQAKVDSDSIQIATLGGCVTLTGHASSWQAIEDAASAAWAAPGVTEVIDRMKMAMIL